MSGWGAYGAAFAVFLLTHSLPLRPTVRARITAITGPRLFSVGYSALSLVVLAWLIRAAGRAPYVQLWGWSAWQAWVPQVVMLLVCVLIAVAIGRPNPFSFGGRNNGAFDPTRAGVVALTRHPLLMALALWSGAHVVPNGDLAHVLLFGGFAGFALLGMRMIDRRKRRDMGERWQALNAACRPSPDAPARQIVQRVTLGFVIYAGLVWLHPWFFGVSPFPGS